MATAGCFSNYTEAAVLKHIFNKETLEQPYIYVGLCAAAPGEAGTGASCHEVPHANGYERATAYYWSEVAGGFVENTAEIVFPEVLAGGWGTVTHFALFDYKEYGLGHMLIYGAITGAPVAVVEGSTPKFAIDEIGMTMD